MAFFKNLKKEKIYRNFIDDRNVPEASNLSSRAQQRLPYPVKSNERANYKFIDENLWQQFDLKQTQVKQQIVNSLEKYGSGFLNSKTGGYLIYGCDRDGKIIGLKLRMKENRNGNDGFNPNDSKEIDFLQKLVDKTFSQMSPKPFKGVHYRSHVIILEGLSAIHPQTEVPYLRALLVIGFRPYHKGAGLRPAVKLGGYQNPPFAYFRNSKGETKRIEGDDEIFKKERKNANALYEVILFGVANYGEAEEGQDDKSLNVDFADRKKNGDFFPSNRAASRKGSVVESAPGTMENPLAGQVYEKTEPKLAKYMTEPRRNTSDV